MEEYKGVTVPDLKAVPFPACGKECPVVGTYGVGECDSFCPDKFDAQGNLKTAIGGTT
jgi:hypothetical protein